jgi:serine/threonine-protein kinase
MSRVCKRCEHVNSDDAKFCLNCGAMLEVEAEAGADPLVGKILLGRYRVNRTLGEGGMGKVYMAEQKMGTAVRKVAIKTLHPELSGDHDLVERFHRECETVIELHHPNTVQFYDFGELEDKTLFIVMELIEGADLAHVLQEGPIDPGRADHLLIQICGSLNEAHQMGIVHRDLKPENVLLTERGGQHDFVKVLDFGIAKRNEAEDSSKAKLTKQGMVLGTPPYMSPEQFSGQSLDARSDIYSLGVMTYEMLTGYLPFSANTPWEWATKHLTAQPIPLETYPQGAALPEPKKAAIMRALSKNREDRHANVLEFMYAFTGIQDAQAAWTMATSAGLSTTGGGFGGAARPPVATPQPMSVGAPVGYRTPGAMIAGSTPSTGVGAFGNAPTQPLQAAPSTGSHAAPSAGSMPATPRASHLGKIVAAVATLMILAGATGAAGLFWWAKHRAGGDSTHVGLPTAPEPQPLPPQIPSTGTTTTTQSTADDPVATGTPSHDVPTTIVDPPPTEPTASADPPPTEEDPAPAEPPPADPPSHSAMRSTRRNPPSNQPSEAELATARNAIRDAEGAMARSDVDGAIRALAQAQRAVGRRHTLVRSAATSLARKGSNMVGILLQQGQCGQAQQLYRRLASVGASGGASQFFSPDWCPRP